MSLLTVKNLSVSFHSDDGEERQAVKNVSFNVGCGEVVGLVPKPAIHLTVQSNLTVRS